MFLCSNNPESSISIRHRREKPLCTQHATANANNNFSNAVSRKYSMWYDPS